MWMNSVYGHLNPVTNQFQKRIYSLRLQNEIAPNIYYSSYKWFIAELKWLVWGCLFLQEEWRRSIHPGTDSYLRDKYRRLYLLSNAFKLLLPSPEMTWIELRTNDTSTGINQWTLDWIIRSGDGNQLVPNSLYPIYGE